MKKIIDFITYDFKQIYAEKFNGILFTLMFLVPLALVLALFFPGQVFAVEYDYFPMVSNYNGMFSNDLAFLKAEAESMAAQNGDTDSSYYMILAYKDGNYTRYGILKSPHYPFYMEINSNNREFSILESDPDLCVCKFYINLNDGLPPENTSTKYGSAALREFRNLESSLYNENKDYYSNFNVMINGINGSDVGLYAAISSPELTDLPTIDELEDYIHSQYDPGTPTNPPSYDSNLSVSENLEQWFSWLGSEITNGLDNLGENIENFFNNLSQTIQDAVNTINNNIWNGFHTLIENIKGFFAPILEAILERLQYITEPVSAAEISSHITSSNLFIDFSSIHSTCSDFISSFNSVSEPNDYVIPLHIENIPQFSSCSTYYLHFNILDPVKNLLRGFLWCLVSYGLIASIFDSIPNYINGGGDES